MIIEENDFKLTPVSDSSPLFNLELLYTVNGKETRKEFKVVAYGITIEHAVKRIIQYRLSNKHDSINLKTYFREFKNELDNIKSLCQIKENSVES